jgi:hypothetical protein
MAICFNVMACNQICDEVNSGFFAAPKFGFARLTKAGDKRFFTGFRAPKAAKATIAS